MKYDEWHSKTAFCVIYTTWHYIYITLFTKIVLKLLFENQFFLYMSMMFFQAVKFFFKPFLCCWKSHDIFISETKVKCHHLYNALKKTKTKIEYLAPKTKIQKIKNSVLLETSSSDFYIFCLFWSVDIIFQDTKTMEFGPKTNLRTSSWINYESNGFT